jgi:hypothetical protein
MKATMSKRDIIDRLRLLGERPNSHWTKGKLQSLLRAVERRKAEKQPSQSTKRQPGVKTILYQLFTKNPDLEITEDELIATHLPGRKPSSIRTWIGRGGLGSEKYGMKVDGKVQPILIERDRATGILRRADV